MKRIVAILASVLLLAGSARLDAADEALRVKLKQPDALGRTGGPVPVDVEIDRQGQGLLQGRLDAAFDRDQAFESCETGDLALPAGTQSFQMLLPPASVPPGESRYVETALSFKTAKERIALGRHVLYCPQESLDQHSILVADLSEKRNDDRVNEMARSLRPEGLLRNYAGDIKWMRAAAAHLYPDELPAYPLGYCSWDLAALKDDAFAELRERQLKALKRWVDAGGAVYVSLAKTRDLVAPLTLRPHHVEFLNALAGPGKSPFTLEPDGRLKFSVSGPRPEAIRARVGLGRAVISVEAESYSSDEWKRSVCFLWKVPRASVDVLVGGDMPSDGPDSRAARVLRGEERDFGQLAALLMPENTQLVPVGLTVLILSLFIVAVGPLDYFLLGILRLRRLTWVLFPALAIGGMLYMFHLTETYMGSGDARNSVYYVDVGRGGEVLRVNRYELCFPAKTQRLETEVHDGFFAGVPIGDADRLLPTGLRGSRETGEERPSFSGRIPTHYTVSRRGWRWTPQLSRIFTLECPAALPKVNWDALETSFPKRSGDEARWQEEVKSRLLGAGDVAADVYVVEDFGLRAVQSPLGFAGARVATDIDRRGYASSSGGQPVARERLGLLWSEFYPRSPTAAGDFEDLAILDAGDPEAKMVVVVTKDGNDWVVCRRVYYGAGGGGQ